MVSCDFTWRVFLPDSRILSPACICQRILWPGAWTPGRGGPPCWPGPRHPPWPPSSRAQSSSRHWSDSPASESGRDDTWHVQRDTRPVPGLLNIKNVVSDLIDAKNFVYQSLSSCLSVPESSVHCATVKHLLRNGDWHGSKSGLKFVQIPETGDDQDRDLVSRTLPLVTRTVQGAHSFTWKYHCVFCCTSVRRSQKPTSIDDNEILTKGQSWEACYLVLSFVKNVTFWKPAAICIISWHRNVLTLHWRFFTWYI